MLAGFSLMTVYFSLTGERSTTHSIIDLDELMELEKILTPEYSSVEIIERSVEKYKGKIDIEAAIVSNGTVWIEGRSLRSDKHVVIPCH